MKWFRKHLNITLLLTWFFLPFIELPLFVLSMWYINNFEQKIVIILLIVANFAPLVLYALVNAWVLKIKKHSYWWLLIMLVDGGFPIAVFLSNNNHENIEPLKSI